MSSQEWEELISAMKGFNLGLIVGFFLRIYLTRNDTKEEK